MSADVGKVSVTLREGEVRQVDAPAGSSLMEAIREAGIDEIMAICGGCCSCGTCHVYTTGGPVTALPSVSDDEDVVLDYSDFRTAQSRLACQLPGGAAIDGLEVTIAPED